MLYVAEYMPNGNLEMAIMRDQERRLGSSKPRLLGWHSHGRSIALDVAHGLAFLHALKARLSCWDTGQSSVCLLAVINQNLEGLYKWPMPFHAWSQYSSGVQPLNKPDPDGSAGRRLCTWTSRAAMCC